LVFSVSSVTLWLGLRTIREQQADFLRRQPSNFARLQVTQRKLADCDANQPPHAVAALPEHAPNLAVLSLGKNDLQNRLSRGFLQHADMSGASAAIGQVDSLAQSAEGLIGNLARSSHPISFREVMFRIGQTDRQASVAGQNQ